MPFDSSPQVEVFAPVEIAKPIDRLIEALRGPEPKWWNFQRCHKCAIEVARKMKLYDRSNEDFWSFVGRRMSMSEWDSAAIFSAKSAAEGKQIRPRHVAAALEHFKLTGEALSPFHFVKLAAREKA